MEWRQGDFLISDDMARIDLDVVHGFLEKAYWCEGVPRDVVQRSIAHSLNFSLWSVPAGADRKVVVQATSPSAERGASSARQVGFARVVSDNATFAYVGDVFVIEEFRGRGLSKWLMRTVIDHPKLQGLRRWVLLTRDAHRLYEQVGFTAVAKPERYMERWDAEVYRRRPS